MTERNINLFFLLLLSRSTSFPRGPPATVLSGTWSHENQKLSTLTLYYSVVLRIRVRGIGKGSCLSIWSLSPLTSHLCTPLDKQEFIQGRTKTHSPTAVHTEIGQALELSDTYFYGKNVNAYEILNEDMERMH
jgi:hypothetical protein